jgi:hypothetical protein
MKDDENAKSAACSKMRRILTKDLNKEDTIRDTNLMINRIEMKKQRMQSKYSVFKSRHSSLIRGSDTSLLNS